jgi:hypothetical protein
VRAELRFEGPDLALRTTTHATLAAPSTRPLARGGSCSTSEHHDAFVWLWPEVFNRVAKERQLDIGEREQGPAGDVDLHR